MTRNVFLSIEATGLDTNMDRVVEIVALEALDLKLTGTQFHVLLDPHHPIEDVARLCTGYDNSRLEGLPKFKDIWPAFVKFLRHSNLITFNPNWSFELINAELERLKKPSLSQHVQGLQDVKSQNMKLGLNVQLTLDNLATIFDCREPVQPCSQTWRDCFMLAQVFPHLVGNPRALALGRSASRKTKISSDR
jgi:DNA polymerase III epsilon subunit-like protein